MKRVIAVTLLLCAGLWCLAQAQEGRPVGPNPTAVGTAAVGQIPGTTTNDAASAGNIGEYVVSGVSARSNIAATATVTLTIASPGVVTWTGNPFFLAAATGNGCASVVNFTTSGSLPTGLTSGTGVYVTCDGSFTANAFHVSSSVANAIAGTALNFTGTQSGTQTGNSATALTSPTAQDFGGLLLSAGDWDVTGIVRFGVTGSTSVTLLRESITTGSALTGTFYSDNFYSSAANVLPGSPDFPMSTERVSLSSPTTLFCGAAGTFTASTMTISGECRARRVR